MTENNDTNYFEALALCEGSHPDFEKAYRLLLESASLGDKRSKYALATWLISGLDGVIEKNEKLGFETLKGLQNSNIAEALFDLAVIYDKGLFIRKNEYKAFSLYVKAALLGDRESCRQVAGFYAEGTIVRYDKTLQKAWEERAEEDVRSISPSYRCWLRPLTPKQD